MNPRRNEQSLGAQKADANPLDPFSDRHAIGAAMDLHNQTGFDYLLLAQLLELVQPSDIQPLGVQAPGVQASAADHFSRPINNTLEAAPASLSRSARFPTLSTGAHHFPAEHSSQRSSQHSSQHSSDRNPLRRTIKKIKKIKKRKVHFEDFKLFWAWAKKVFWEGEAPPRPRRRGTGFGPRPRGVQTFQGEERSDSILSL